MIFLFLALWCSITLKYKVEIIMFKNKSLITFLICIIFIFLLLCLDLGYGLILTLSLYCVSQVLMKLLTKKLPFIISKIITSILIISFFVLVYFSIQFAIKNAIHTLMSDNGHTLQIILNSLEEFKQKLPTFFAKKIPSTQTDIEQIIGGLSASLNQHLIWFGGSSLNYFFQTLFSLIISISLIKKPNIDTSPAIQLLKNNFMDFINYFKVLMIAQIYVAVWNTLWLSIYLFIILPLFGIELSYKKTLTILTLFVSLVPALGNIVSNTALIILCIPHGVYVIIASLIFMILIHKAEYLINAKIVGQKSKANVVEILMALIIFELLFGLDGLILGPVIYVYVKNFLLKEKIL